MQNKIERLKEDLTVRLERIIKKSMLQLNEDAMNNEFEEAIRRLEAAKRAVGIVNRLPKGEYRKKHASRVFTNLNRLRSLVMRLERNLIQTELSL